MKTFVGSSLALVAGLGAAVLLGLGPALVVLSLALLLVVLGWSWHREAAFEGAVQWSGDGGPSFRGPEHWRRWILVGGWTVVISWLLLTAGCIVLFSDPAPSSFSVINETDRQLRVEDGYGGTTYVEPNGGLTGVGVNDCARIPVQAYWPDGTLVAARHRACDDQVWIIVDRGCTGIRVAEETEGLRLPWDRQRLGC